MDESKRSLDIKSQESVNTEVLKNNILSKWSESDEELLKEWADDAVCYRCLHENAHKKYNEIYFQTSKDTIISNLREDAMVEFQEERFITKLPQDNNKVDLMAVKIIDKRKGLHADAR
jgi:CRISPR/Cas system endoribonuclease Cas6 (RAMP superfamily)